MCIHCRRLRSTPCPKIPYSCPLCPVHTISSSCSASRRSSGEDPFRSARTPDPPSDPCKNSSERWLEVNSRVICALAKRMNRTPETAHYAVLFLLYANYKKVNLMDGKRRSFRAPRSGLPEQELFSTKGSLFNDNGYLKDPLSPSTLGKLLRMLQEYISGLRQLNKRFKWYANGEDRGDILCLLGEQDELVRLLRQIFGTSGVVSIPGLLRALSDLNLNYLFGKSTSGKSPWPVKSISDLYSEVVNPYKVKKDSSGGSRASANQIKEVTNKDKKKPDTGRPGGQSTKSRVQLYRNNDKQLPLPRNNEEQLQLPRKTPSYYIQYENPKLFQGLIDSKKNSTCRTRHSASERVLPNGPTAKRRVPRSMDGYAN